MKYANLTETLQRVGISETSGIIAAATPHAASKCHGDPSNSCRVVADRLSPLSQTASSAAEKHHLQNSCGEVEKLSNICNMSQQRAAVAAAATAQALRLCTPNPGAGQMSLL